MNYPLISEYIEAIKNAEENFEQLKSLRPVLGDDGEPVFSGGNFAVVFKMKDEQTGKLHAVKCFLREQEGRAEAYRMIAEELEYVNSTFLTPIKYLDKELFVDSKNSDESEFPVLLMDWVEGQTLDKYIQKYVCNYQRAENLDETTESEEKAVELLVNGYELEKIAYQFSCLAIWLLQQPFAHGDLKPDNIIVKEDGRLVLVDYDGMYVPAMKGQKARELGSPDFRHPLRNENDFDEHIDDFPLSSILLSLLAIANEPSLLEKYGGDGRLLLSERDYRNIAESEVLDALRPLMADKNLTTYLSLFYLCSAQKSLFKESYHLFTLPEPEKPSFMLEEENLSSEVTEEDLADVWTDEYGAKYSMDRERLLYVPHNIKEYSIKQGTKVICDNAFNEPGFENNSLEKVIIPDTVTHIGNHAFGACFSLQDISLPDSIIHIGDCAFSHCYKITFGIPKMVRYIGEGAFWRCLSLNNINIPVTIDCIESDTFRNCNSLTTVTISNAVYIGSSAFQGCTKLESIVLPDGLKTIGLFAFSGCTSIISIRIPNSVSKIGDGAFSGCSYLTNTNLPDSITEVGKEIFHGCAIPQISIPNSVIKIGNRAFWDCNINKIFLPTSVSIIEDGAFYGSALTQITIPDSVKKISDEAFGGCFALMDVDIPNTITEIGISSFAECSSLEQVILPNSVKTIKGSAFAYCESLKNIAIPDSVVEIGDCVFAQCFSLESITLSENIERIGDSVFGNCDFLKRIVIPSGTRNIFEDLLPEYKDKLVEQ